MSDMKKLLESMTKFAGEPEQKPGDQVRGTDKAKHSKDHPFKGRLVGASESVDPELIEALMTEYRYFVKEVTTGNVAPGNPTSPVASINPAGTGTQQAQQPGQPQQAQQPQQPGQPQQAQQAPTPQEVQKAKQDITSNVTQLKAANPNIDPNKIATALTKDPKTMSSVDKEAIGQLGAAVAPALKDKAAMGNLKSVIQKVS